jgi:hypothetical protein
MLNVYQTLLRLYPRPYRQQFADEMIAVFRDVDAEAQREGIAATAKFYLREITGLFRGAMAEHVRHFLGSDVSSPFSSRRFTMRSGFRFPKTTAFLMTVILAGIVLAIEKAESIRASVPYNNPPVGPIQPAHLTILTTMALTFLLVYAAGAVAWVVLFALRRSGVHRLSEMTKT